MRIPFRKSEQQIKLKRDSFLTQDKLDELKQQLDKIIKLVRPEAIKEVNRLSQTGDFSENHAYQMAKGRLRGLNQKILELKTAIKYAQIIVPNKNTSTVQIGHKVTVANRGQTKIYQILGSTESDPATGKISHLSPLGKALLGSKTGETIKIKLADKIVEYKIIKIE